MNTNQNVSFGSGVGPSGSEVESAMFVPEVLPRRSDLRGRLDELKSRGLSKVSGVRRVMSDRTSSSMTKVQSSMRENPVKWAGIAAGSGFALGMLGRFIHWRNDHRRHSPQLVVIETSC